MPHQCVRCGEIYSNGSKELLKGCSKCGGKFFFYIRKKEMMKKAEKIRKKLSKKQVKNMEKDVREIVKEEKKEKPVILDIETIKVKSPGKYEIDVVSLMRGNPIIINIGEGKYYIDLVTAFEKKKKIKSKK